MLLVRAEMIKGKVLLSQTEFDDLVELARRGESVDPESDGTPSAGIVATALAGRKGGITWGAEDEDLYGRDDMKVRYGR